MEVVYIGGFGKLAMYFRKNTDYSVTERNKNSALYLDLEDLSRSNIINKKDCLFVIGAAISEPSKCEINLDYCTKINYHKTCDLIELLLYNNKVLFLSSDLVFEGINFRTPNDEDSIPHPISLYSRLKLAVEKKFFENENFFIARLSYVLFENNSFTNYLENCLINGETPEIIHPLIRNCTEPNKLSDYIDKMSMEMNYYKIKHICGPPLSRLDIFKLWCSKKQINLEYKTLNINDSLMKNYPSNINFITKFK